MSLEDRVLMALHCAVMECNGAVKARRTPSNLVTLVDDEFESAMREKMLLAASIAHLGADIDTVPVASSDGVAAAIVAVRYYADVEVVSRDRRFVKFQARIPIVFEDAGVLD